MPTESTSTASRQSIARREFITEGALVIAGVTARSSVALAESNPEISSSEEAIHQRRTFAANRSRVYAALTVEEQFDRIVRLSGVMKADTQANMQHPTKLSTHAGGAFSVFDGYIVGRQLELVPNERIVQAWRVLSAFSVGHAGCTPSPGLSFPSKREQPPLCLTTPDFRKEQPSTWPRDGKSITGIRSPKYWHSSLRVC